MFFSKFLNAIRENLTSDEKFQSVNHDLQKLLPWFLIDNFVHNIDLIALSKKNFSTTKFRRRNCIGKTNAKSKITKPI